jgi:hypothetical protein
LVMASICAKVALLGSAVLLTACQPPTYTIIATTLSGQTVFTARDDGTWPFGWGDDGIYAERMTVSRGNAVVWEITRQPMAGCRSSDDHDPYPVTYGVTPPCWQQSHPAARLEPGVTYTVEGDALRHGRGTFVVGGAAAVAAVKPDAG